MLSDYLQSLKIYFSINPQAMLPICWRVPMKMISKWLLCVAMSASFTTAQAGNAQGLVSGIFVHTPGVLMFLVGTTINSAPSCATRLNQWAISLTDPMGKSLMALLLSAQAQGKQVYVHGYTNTCRDWGDRELPSYAFLID
jgi:hypothetical protein